MRSLNKDDIKAEGRNETFCDHCNTTYYKSTFMGKFCCVQCKSSHHNMKRFPHFTKFMDHCIPTCIWWLAEAKLKIKNFMLELGIEELKSSNLVDAQIESLLKEIGYQYVLEFNTSENLNILNLVNETDLIYYGVRVEELSAGLDDE